MLRPYGCFLLVSLFLVSACSSRMDRIFSSTGKDSDKVKALRGLGQEALREALCKAIPESLSRGATLSGEAMRSGLLMEALLGIPGGRTPVVDAYVRLKKQITEVPEPLWRGFSSIARYHQAWVTNQILRPSGVVPPSVLSDMLAGHFLQGGAAGRAFFIRLLEDYALQPALFQAAFRRMPLADFQALADFSYRELRLLGIKRIEAILDRSASRLVSLQKIVAAGYPVLAVLVTEKLFEPEYRRYRALATASAVRRTIRKEALSLYWFLTQLRGHFRTRREGEQQMYAAIVKTLYDVQSGQ